VFTSLKLTSVEDQLIGCILLHFQSGYVCVREKEMRTDFYIKFFRECPTADQVEKVRTFLNPLHLICTLV